jgi:flagellar basal body-associated protein FliL
MNERDAPEDSSPPTKRRIPVPAVVLRPEVWGAAVVLVALALFVAATLSAIPDQRGGARAVVLPMAGPITFHALPELVADLKGSRSRAHYVQLAAVVEVAAESVGKLREKEVEITAAVQARLRDLSTTDLAGSAGVERLRADVLAVIDEHLSPAKARTVLFTRFLVD